MDKKYIKKLVIRRVLPIALALTQTGCGHSYESNANSENVFQKMAIVLKGKQDTNDSFIHNDEIDETGIFFQKVNGEEVTIDDIILTNEERNIRDNGTEYYQRMLSKQIEEKNMTENEFALISKLHVSELLEEFWLFPFVTNSVEKHKNSKLYMEEKNDLDWDALFDILKENSDQAVLERQKEIKMAYKMSKEVFYTVEPFQSLNDENLKLWITQFHEYIDFVKKQTSNFDMRRLACILEDFQVIYKRETTSDSFTLATTTPRQVAYNLWNGFTPNLEALKQTSFHEFYHVLDSPCKEEENKFGYLWASGMSMKADLLYDKKFLKKHHIEEGDLSFYIPFCYFFLEESNAEKTSSRFLDTELSTYFDKQFTTQNLDFSLSLQQGYQHDAFVKANLLHNPIALIQQFPILNGTSESEKEWLIAQLEMLECYNIINSSNQFARFASDDSSVENLKTIACTLENYADLQMTRNFLWNLINCRNTTKTNMTVEDYYYLMKLYQARLKQQRKGVCMNFSLETLDTKQYLEEQKKLLLLFEEYLKEHFPMNTLSYQDYNLEEGRLSSSFTEEEKRYYYNLYLEIKEYQKTLEDQNLVSSKDLENKMKVYYFIPGNQ